MTAIIVGTILTFVAFLCVVALIMGAIFSRMDREEDAEVLRILATSPHPMPGAAVCKMLGSLRPRVRASAYLALSRLEDRGLVERIVGPAFTANVGSYVYTFSGVHSFRLTDAGRAAVTPPARVG